MAGRARSTSTSRRYSLGRMKYSFGTGDSRQSPCGLEIHTASGSVPSSRLPPDATFSR